MAEYVYVLCFATSAAVAFLLLRSYVRTRHRILFWSGLGFVGTGVGGTSDGASGGSTFATGGNRRAVGRASVRIATSSIAAVPIPERANVTVTSDVSDAPRINRNGCHPAVDLSRTDISGPPSESVICSPSVEPAIGSVTRTQPVISNS